MASRLCAWRRASFRFVASIAAAAAAACSSGSSDHDAPAEPPLFTTTALLAGAVDAGGAGDMDGVGPTARFDGLTGLAVADDGVVWISEQGPDRIRRIGANGRVETVLHLATVATGPDQDGVTRSYVGPVAMVQAGRGAVFVTAAEVQRSAAASETARWVVLRVEPDGRASVAVRPSSAQAGSLAASLTLDRAGRLLVGSFTGCGIWRALPGAPGADAVDAKQVLSTSARGEGRACGEDAEAMRAGVTGLAIDAQDRLVYLLANGDVKRQRVDGGIDTLATGLVDFSWCGAILADADGGLLVSADTAILALSKDGVVRAWAGSRQEAGWFDGPRERARLGKSCGMAASADGSVYVADQYANTVRRIDRSGVVHTVAGLARQAARLDGTGAAARFSEEMALAPAHDGTLLVADRFNHAVRRIDGVGRVSTVVQALSSDGAATQVWGLNMPGALLPMPDGSLWIASVHSLQHLPPGGPLRHVLSTSPLPLLADEGAGRIAVLDHSAGYAHGQTMVIGLRRLPADPRHGTDPVSAPLSWPDPLMTAPPLLAPRGLCSRPGGELFFTMGAAVLRRAPDGSISVWAGHPREPGARDGDAQTARFNDPSGLHCEADRLFVADTGNHLLRVIDAQRRVRTVLGRAGVRGVPDGSTPGLLDAPRSIAPFQGGLAVQTGLGVIVAR